MADEIKQVFGFDITQAMNALTQMESGFNRFTDTLRQSPASFDVFNKGAGRTVSALKQIQSNADAAASSLGKLNNVKPPPSIPGGGLNSGSSSGASAAAGLQQQFVTGAAATAAMNKLLGQTTSSTNQAANAMANGSRAASGFALNLETITRVIGTQFIVRGLNSIRQAVEDSFQGFINFDRAIQEIRTLSTDPVDKLSGSIRSLSDEFNSPLLDVAHAKYEILQNGFSGATESSQILTAALKFSKVGLATVTESVDLISTSLNAYGKSADEAATISAKLFKTIDLGRVVGSELAQSFGRVAPVGKEIGATEDELLAAFSSITIGGVSASEAATQIRATLVALLKPSEDASKAFKQLGVTTGEQLVATYGFKGALDALIGTTDGSTTAIAKLFPNVRALNGVLRETGTGATIFEEHLSQIRRASAELLNQKFELRIDSNAERVSKDLNQLKNFFTVDLGANLVGSLSAVFQFIGGVKTLTSLMGALAPTVALATTALVAYQVSAGVAAIRTNLLAASAELTAGKLTKMQVAALSAKGALAGLVAIAAAASVGYFIGDQITRGLEAAQKKALEESQSRTNFERAQGQARVNLINMETDDKVKTLLQSVADVGKVYNEELSGAKEKNDELIADDKAAIDKLIQGRTKYAEDLVRGAIRAENDIIASKKRSNDIQGQLDDARFNFRDSRLTAQQVSTRDVQRARQLANQGANLLRNANTPQQQEAAQSAFQRAEAFAQQAASAAKTTGELGRQLAAERTFEQVLRTRLAAEKQFQQTRDQAASKLNAAAASERKRVTELSQAGKAFLEATSLFDKKGNPLSDNQLAKNADKAKAALATLKDKGFGGELDISKLLAFDKLEQRLSSALTQGEVKNLFASNDTLAALRNKVQVGLSQRAYLIKIAPDPESLKDLNSSELIQALFNQLRQQGEDTKKTTSDKETIKQNATEIDAKTGDITKSVREQDGWWRSILTHAQDLLSLTGSIGKGALFTMSGKGLLGFQDDNFKAKAELEAVRKEIEAAAKNPNSTTGNVNDLGTRLDKLAEKIPLSGKLDHTQAQIELGLLTEIVRLRAQDRSLQQTGNAAAATGADEIMRRQLQAAEAEKRRAEAAKQQQGAAQGAATPSEQLRQSAQSTATSAFSTAQSYMAAADAAERMATALAQISPQEPGKKAVQTAAKGSVMMRPAMYLAAGGQAVGTDTVPAMLSPEETVINPNSSRKFFSQLQAMNAGLAPNFRQGGDSIHINVGDVIMPGGSSTNITPYAIAREIERGQRIGRVKKSRR